MEVLLKRVLYCGVTSQNRGRPFFAARSAALLPRPTTQIPLDLACLYLFLNFIQSPQLLLPAYLSPGETSHICIICTLCRLDHL